MGEPQHDEHDEALEATVSAALDDLLGAAPSELVEERPEPDDPSVENEAMSHLYRSPSRFYGLG